jgi:hypothetical protein
LTSTPSSPEQHERNQSSSQKRYQSLLFFSQSELNVDPVLGDTAKSSTPTSPKSRKRGRAALDGSDSTPVAKQHLSVREGGDIDLGMLDQEAFARVIASSGQQTALSSTEPIEPVKDVVVEEADEEEGAEVTDDVTYRPSGVPDGADPIWGLRMTCLPVLDILVPPPLPIFFHSNLLCRARKF